MFEKNYRNAMDNIKADDTVKNRILDKITAYEEKSNNKNAAVPWRIGFAVAACAAIVLSIIFVPKGKPTAEISANTLSAADSYSEIFKIISKHKKSDEEVFIEDFVEYEYEYESFNDADGVTNDISKGNTSSQNKTEDSNREYSDTTTQVEGVSEADIVKTDGNYIYALNLSKSSIYILKADGINSSIIKTISLDSENYCSYRDMYLSDNKLVVIQELWNIEDDLYSSIIIYDVSIPEETKETAVCRQKGTLNSTRMIGKYVYMITNCYVNANKIEKDEPETYVPTTICKDEEIAVSADSIYRYGDNVDSPEYTVICAYDIDDGTLTSSCNLLGGTDQIYCSTQNIITANAVYDHDIPEESSKFIEANTTVSRISISNGDIKYIATGTVTGTLENQFYIDEYKGNFRFVTTADEAVKSTVSFANTKRDVISYTNNSYACLTILDGDMNELSFISNLAEGERVYSVRFMGDIAYFVTFRQTDPLFSADLSDPKNPKIIGELKIPGFSEYLYPYGEGLLLGFGRDADERSGASRDLKLSMFNTTDPANVTEQDVTVVDGYRESPALYNHKAMLVSPKKNLIGFEVIQYGEKSNYLVYEYTDNKFIQKANLSVDSKDNYYDRCRGMFINDFFYLTCDEYLQVYSLSDFTLCLTVNF